MKAELKTKMKENSKLTEAGVKEQTPATEQNSTTKKKSKRILLLLLLLLLMGGTIFTVWKNRLTPTSPTVPVDTDLVSTEENTTTINISGTFKEPKETIGIKVDTDSDQKTSTTQVIEDEEPDAEPVSTEKETATSGLTESTPSQSVTQQPTQTQTPAPVQQPQTVTQQPTTQQPAATHTHTWVHHEAVTHTVHHDAETKVVHHTEEQVWVDSYDTITVSVCHGCGARFYNPGEADQHCTDAMLADEAAGIYDESQGHGSYAFYIDYEFIDTSHYETKPAWDETVVVKPAWDEVVVDSPAYDECSSCGARQ